eukprot:TRINITY_DN10804_c0_g1_i2.p1 TRINITY_DN10804_c0_g1~~TRINITY_DN10804_c0_g1_i2.p1  ORF type:complete len:152 (-),score=36.24 TRINITY_DN10804_c0_g1_i2:43-498(-)
MIAVRFSSVNKAANIVVSSDGCVASESQNIDDTFVLCEGFDSGVVSWSSKVNSNYASIGVSSSSSLPYSFMDQSTWHVYFNGTSYFGGSNVSSDLRFSNGDVVKVTLECASRRVTISNVTSPSSVSFVPTGSGKLYPCFCVRGGNLCLIDQ